MELQDGLSTQCYLRVSWDVYNKLSMISPSSINRVDFVMEMDRTFHEICAKFLYINFSLDVLCSVFAHIQQFLHFSLLTVLILADVKF